MQLVNVRDRFITLEMTPQDCILLREACTAARDRLSWSDPPRYDW